MSSGAGHAFTPMTAVGRPEPNPPTGFVLARDDYGAFRAVEAGTDDIVALRCTHAGLRIERREGREVVAWSDVRGLALTLTAAGRAEIPTVVVALAAGASLDLADALAPGADELPLTLGPGRNRLLRVERLRLLTAVIASAAGLAPATLREFAPGPRGVELPEMATRPRVLPRWAAPFLFAASVGAIAFLTDVGWAGAFAVMAVIAFHELGHAVAMRLVRLKVRGILFLPLLGAATLPEHGFPTRWHEARVALAGPATGLPMAAVLGIGLALHPGPDLGRETLVAALAWALGVNLLNLFPMLPLDGGRVLGCLTASAPPLLRATAAFAPILALGALAAAALRGPALVAALVFLAVCLSLTRTSLRRQSLHDWMGTLPQSLADVRTALRDVTRAFTGRARDDVDGGVAPSPLTAPQLILVLGLYALETVALLVACVWFLTAVPGVFDTGG